MKKILLVVAFLLAVGVVNAYAVPVTFNTDELYDWGRLYSYDGAKYTPTNTNPAPYGTNPIAGYTITQNTVGNADGAEDTWGVGTVASIKTLIGNVPIWTRTPTEELSFMFYGFDDDALSNPNIFGDVTLGSKAGHVAIYLRTAGPYFDGNLGTGGRTGVASYTGVGPGPGSLLVLDLAPVANPAGFTLQSSFDFGDEVGAGNMFLSTTGLGAWDYLYNTNTQLYGSDIRLSYTVRDNVNPIKGDWTVRGDLGGESNLVPEPMSMFMVMMGALGFGVTQRKRKQIV